MLIAICGAGGMIGGHLVRALLNQGHAIRAVDIKPQEEWWQWHDEELVSNRPGYDLRDQGLATSVLFGCEQVYDLAENMGGIGFIESNRIDCAESIEIGISLLRAAVRNDVQRFFFASSACVYNTALQTREYEATFGKTSLSPSVLSMGLRERDAWPAQPEAGYGFSKLYMEELCRHYQDEKGLEVRIARYHNVYGAHGSWRDGREKAPAALCRKVANAVMSGEDHISIWGNGRQLRSYLDVHDCVRGTIALMQSGCSEPMNIGSDQAVSVTQLAHLVEGIAGVELQHNHHMQAAQGVDGRNADITMARAVLAWEPYIPLEEGIQDLYEWIEEQVNAASGVRT